MYAIYYHKPGNESRCLHPVAGCGSFSIKQTAIDTAIGFARHPEGCLGYYPTAPVKFVVVELIGCAESVGVVWTPYEGECDKQSHEHPYAIPKSERK